MQPKLFQLICTSINLVHTWTHRRQQRESVAFEQHRTLEKSTPESQK